MNKSKPEGKNPKDLLRQANRAAAGGDRIKSLMLFESCIRQYLSRQMTLKALAAAKDAKTVLGPLPKVQSMLIRLYLSMGLHGDAGQEYTQCCRNLRKDETPFLEGLHREAFLDLMDIIELIPVRKGQAIMKQHELGADIFIIVSGSFSVIRDGITESTLNAGCVFGELGFFHHQERSATVRATEGAELIRIPSEKLRELSKRYTCLKDSLEHLYTERTLKKASEDLRYHSLIDVYRDDLMNVRFPKGQIIPFDTTTDITIIKHGVVEIDYDEQGMKKKRFLKPGSVIEKFSGTARANTDVELLRGTIDLLS